MNDHASALRVGLIGLGAMGEPMARHLHARGMLRVVGNRSLAKAEGLATELGVLAGASTADFVNCNTLILCVSADTDVLENVSALALALQPGSVVVDHSTVARATAQQAAALLVARGIRFIDAPVSGGVEGARTGRLSIMAGGDATDLEHVRPALEAYAARITLMGDVGAGQSTKAVNQVLVAGISQAVCEGLALGEALGLDPERLLPTLGAGAAANWFLDKRGATMLRSEFTPGFRCAHLLKDLRIVDEMATQAGVAHPVLLQSLADYAELVARGRGADDTSALITLKREGGALLD